MGRDRLTVQRDDLAEVVRLVIEDDQRVATVELLPDEAERVGEDILRNGRDLQTAQATLTDSAEPPADQDTLEAVEPVTERKPLESLLDRADNGDNRVEMGGVLNDDDPLEW